jgi:hypothetical protein
MRIFYLVASFMADFPAVSRAGPGLCDAETKQVWPPDLENNLAYPMFHG